MTELTDDNDVDYYLMAIRLGDFPTGLADLMDKWEALASRTLNKVEAKTLHQCARDLRCVIARCET